MFSQFQSHYPTGSLTAELVQIHEGYYIVKAAVQVGDVILATAMSSATTIEQAEDRARYRALAVLGIEPSLDDSPVRAHLMEQPTPNRLSPAPSSQSNGFEQPAFPDWNRPDSVEARDTDGAAEPSSAAAALKVEASDRQEVETRGPEPDLELATKASPPSRAVSTKPPGTPGAENGHKSQPPGKEPPTAHSGGGPLDLSDIIAQTSVELKRLGWTNAQGRAYLQQTYGKRSRQQLTDEELLDFLDHLQSQSAQNEPLF